MDCSLLGSSVHGTFQQGYWSGLPFPSPADLPRPRDGTHVSCFSCIAERFFTTWAIREALLNLKWKWKSLSHARLFATPWNSSGQNTGVGSLSLLQGIFPNHGSNPGLLRCRQILYKLSHRGSPRILEWVASHFSSGSSWLRSWTGVSCTAGRLFTIWVIREAT